MSPADSADHQGPLRLTYGAELEQLRLQIEVMGLRVDQNLERMREVLVSGDPVLAAKALGADDEIDVSECVAHRACPTRCSVARTRWPLTCVWWSRSSGPRASSSGWAICACGWSRRPSTTSWMASSSAASTSSASWPTRPSICSGPPLRAWASDDLDLATQLAAEPRPTDLAYAQLVDSLLRLEGPDAVAIALHSLVAGQAFERIGDHAAVLGTRLRYLITGDPNHLAGGGQAVTDDDRAAAGPARGDLTTQECPHDRSAPYVPPGARPHQG